MELWPNEHPAPDERWAYVGAPDRLAYNKLLALPPLSDAVHADAAGRLRRCGRLAEHAYFNYEFLDIALEYALMTIELLLRRHLGVQTGKLSSLISQLESRGHGELARKCGKLRSVRNILAHPSHDFFGGITMAAGLRGVYDLANEVASAFPLERPEAGDGRSS